MNILKPIHLIASVSLLGAAGLFTTARAAETVIAPDSVVLATGEALRFNYVSSPTFATVIQQGIPHSFEIEIRSGYVLAGPATIDIPPPLSGDPGGSTDPQPAVFTFQRFQGNNLNTALVHHGDSRQDSVDVSVAAGEKFVLFPGSELLLSVEKDAKTSLIQASETSTTEMAGPCTVTLVDIEDRSRTDDSYFCWAVVEDEVVVSPLGELSVAPGVGVITIQRSTDLTNWSTLGQLVAGETENVFYRLVSK